MKNIFRLLVLIPLGITIYTIFFWEPKNYCNYTSEEKSEETYSSTVSNLNVDNANVNNIKQKENSHKSIFKVSEETLNKSISQEDRIKIDMIVNSMSELDIDKIRKEENNVDKEEGTRNILKILRKRLSSKDYKIIKNIYNPYIDFTNI